MSNSSSTHPSNAGRTEWTLAVLVGIAGAVAFNVIIGVFGDPLAIAGLVAFAATSILVIRRHSRREHDHV